MEPIVVDTNVVTSALLTKDPDSPPARIIKLVRAGKLDVLVSAELLDECRDVLMRDHIRERHGLSAEKVDMVLAELAANARIINPPPGPSEGPDPDDSHLWRLLRCDANAVLITGDRALLAAPPAWAVVMTPRDWINNFGNDERDH